MSSPLRIYIAHAYSDDPAGNCAKIREICRRLVGRGYHPVAPQLWLDQLFDEATQREEIMQYCLDELDSCETMYRYTPCTGGVAIEVKHASKYKIPERVMYYGVEE
jgi:hypothetical protein